MKRIGIRKNFTNEMLNLMPEKASEHIKIELSHKLANAILEEFKPKENTRSFGYSTAFELDLAIGETDDFKEVIKTLDSIIEVSKSLPIDSVYVLALRAKMLLLKD